MITMKSWLLYLIEDKEKEFKRMVLLKQTNGVLSRDTIRLMVESVNPDEMRASLAISRESSVSSLKGYHVIIDGKKLRGENPTSKGCNGLYILNAMVSEHEICISEERVDDKTNELTVFPSVIASLSIVRALISVDAIGTHMNITQQIVMQDGDYLIALKDNQLSSKILSRPNSTPRLLSLPT